MFKLLPGCEGWQALRFGARAVGLVALMLAVAGCVTLSSRVPSEPQAAPSLAISGPAVTVEGLDPTSNRVATVPASLAAPLVVTNSAADADPDNKQLYRVHAGDTIHLQVIGEDDISGDFKVSADGTILHSLLGRTVVEGSTVEALERSLVAAFAKDYLVNPKVYVDVRTSVARRVILFGEVKTPGVYELPVGDKFSLLQLIAKAGGFTDVADTDRVRVVRRDSTGDRRIQVNVTDLLRGRGTDKDLELLPTDVITVPQTVF